MGNQADITTSSIFQSLKIQMNTILIGVSSTKIRFPDIKPNPGKTHHQKNGL